MPSPFPGMDPYLEGYLWPDVHQQLAAEIRRRLTPQIRPRYVARLAISTFIDPNPEPEIGVMYPDVEVLRNRDPAPIAATDAHPSTAVATPAIAEPITVPMPQFQVRLVTVEIRDTAENQLVTSIEILSPVNKRQPGLGKFQEKQQRLRDAYVHLLTIDLIRRGERPMTSPHLPQTLYLVALIRAGADSMAAWPIQLREALPVVAVPLRAPDADVPLELGPALATIYDEAAYDLSINYNEPPPPPPLDENNTAWMRKLLSET